ncbi:MAG: 50S ribosomal protein L4 [Kiritimatiellaeota bacterium]|nr:50S ribosomal protein L4 [Kiritimatiellota bacterium]
MSVLKMYNSAGAAAGGYEVADGLLTLDRGAQAVKDVVTATMNARRAGTASTLTKGEVAGTGKKPFKQKGTGRARAGTKRNPVWRGGGVAFGPRPRDFGQKVNRKVVQLAFRRALSDKIASGALVVVEDLNLAEIKTKPVVALLKALGLADTTVMLVDTEVTENLAVSARNLPNVMVDHVAGLDVWSILRFKALVVTRAAMEGVKARLAPAQNGEAAQ